MAVCKIANLQTETSVTPTGEENLNQPGKTSVNFDVGYLINQTCKARGYCYQINNPTLESVQTSFFLFTCFSRLGRDNAAWFHLGESITMLQLLRLHEESTYTSITDPQYAQYRRRTFWLLFNAERGYALQRPLRRSINLPTAIEGFDNSEKRIPAGFLDAIALFRNFGDGFLSLWNTSENSVVSPKPLLQLQQFLQCSIPNVSERLEMQQAYLHVNRQWLKMLVWQLCLSKGLLSSNSVIDSMSFHFPVEIA